MVTVLRICISFAVPLTRSWSRSCRGGSEHLASPDVVRSSEVRCSWYRGPAGRGTRPGIRWPSAWQSAWRLPTAAARRSADRAGPEASLAAVGTVGVSCGCGGKRPGFTSLTPLFRRIFATWVRGFDHCGPARPARGVAGGAVEPGETARGDVEAVLAGRPSRLPLPVAALHPRRHCEVPGYRNAAGDFALLLSVRIFLSASLSIAAAFKGGCLSGPARRFNGLFWITTFSAFSCYPV